MAQAQKATDNSVNKDKTEKTEKASTILTTFSIKIAPYDKQGTPTKDDKGKDVYPRTKVPVNVRILSSIKEFVSLFNSEEIALLSLNYMYTDYLQQGLSEFLKGAHDKDILTAENLPAMRLKMLQSAQAFADTFSTPIPKVNAEELKAAEMAALQKDMEAQLASGKAVSPEVFARFAERFKVLSSK